jgi:hypothetical protein
MKLFAHETLAVPARGERLSDYACLRLIGLLGVPLCTARLPRATKIGRLSETGDLAAIDEAERMITGWGVAMIWNTVRRFRSIRMTGAMGQVLYFPNTSEAMSTRAHFRFAVAAVPQ